jgi:hypothetical protein
MTTLAKEHDVTRVTAQTWKKAGKLEYVTVVLGRKLPKGTKPRQPAEFKAYYKPLKVTQVEGNKVTELEVSN